MVASRYFGTRVAILNHECRRSRENLDAYDTSFNLTTHIVGVLNESRITMGTTVNDLM